MERSHINSIDLRHVAATFKADHFFNFNYFNVIPKFHIFIKFFPINITIDFIQSMKIPKEIVKRCRYVTEFSSDNAIFCGFP